MRVTLKSFFRAIMALLAVASAWSLWASAQTATNLTTNAATNQSSILLREVEQLDGRYLAGILEINLAVKARFDTGGISFA